jgi:hypothetical protein
LWVKQGNFSAIDEKVHEFLQLKCQSYLVIAREAVWIEALEVEVVTSLMIFLQPYSQ